MASIEERPIDSPDSSPDPLSKSIDRLYPPSSPLKRKHNSTDQNTLEESSPIASRDSSPSKHRKTSPTKNNNSAGSEQQHSIVFHTPNKSFEGGGVASLNPWKIRVTVEAEPDEHDRMDNALRSKTIMVPLKGEDEHSSVKRRSTRLEANTQSATPGGQSPPIEQRDIVMTPESNARQPRMNFDGTGDSPDPDPDSALITAATETAGKTPSRKRGRPSKMSTATGTKVSAVEEAEPTFAVPKRMTRSMGMNFDSLTPLHQKAQNTRLVDDSAIITPAAGRRAKLVAASQKIRNRIPTPRKPAGYNPDNSSSPPPASPNKVLQEQGNNDDSFVNESTVPAGGGESVMTDASSIGEADEKMVEQDDADGGDFEQDDADDENVELNDAVEEDVEEDDVDENDMMTGTEDDTTVLDRSAVESEGFSMVSIDSLRSQRRQTETQSTGSLMPAVERAAAFTSEVASTTMSVQQKVVQISTRLPSPQRSDNQQGLQLDANGMNDVPASNGRHTRRRIDQKPSPDTTNVESAGEGGSESDGSSRKRKAVEDAFAPYGNGTKRRLRGSLALGEFLARTDPLLARREAQYLKSQEGSSPHDPTPTATDPHVYPRLPTPAESVASTAGQDRNKSTQAMGTTSPDAQQPPVQTFTSSPPIVYAHEHDEEIDTSRVTIQSLAEGQDHSITSRSQLLERVIQRERQDVIRQALEANTSKVVFIPSDDDNREQSYSEASGSLEEPVHQEQRGEATLADIWQQEADRSLDGLPAPRNGNRKRSRQEVQEPTPDLRDLLGEDLRPPRAKLPRTWRRTSGNDFLYSDEVASPAHTPSAPLHATVTALAPPMGKIVRDIENQKSQHEGGEKLQSHKIHSRNSMLDNPPAFKLPQSSLSKSANPRGASLKGHSKATGHRSQLKPTTSTGTNITTNKDNAETTSVEDEEESDVRQLRSELNAAANANESSILAQPENEPPSFKETTKPLKNLLRSDPNKKIPRLFDEDTQSSQAQQTVHTTHPHPFSNLYTAQLNANLSNTHTTITYKPRPRLPPPTLYMRFRSWFEFTFSAPDSTPLRWTDNHWNLLRHFFCIISNPTYTNTHPSLPPLHPAYHDPLDCIPFAFQRFLNHNMSNQTRNWVPLDIPQHWIRVTWAFVMQVSEHGVSLELPPSKGKQYIADMKTGTWPIRDENGDVVYVKEEWKPACVLKKMFALWNVDPPMVPGALPVIVRS